MISAAMDIPDLHLHGKWNSKAITYTFLDEPAYYETSGTFVSLSEAHRNIARSVIQRIKKYIPIDFIEITQDNNNKQVGDIAVSLRQMSATVNGVSFTPIGPLKGGDIELNTKYKDDPSEDFEAIFLHEFLHSLGLEHVDRLPSEYVEENRYSFSVVSNALTRNHLKAPLDLQLYDISVLQYLYGAAANEEGNNLYKFGSHPYYPISIWDTGGNDTISAEDSLSGSLINLNDTSFSYIGKVKDYSGNGSGQDFTVGNSANNVSIALNVVIENALGSKYSDIIIGNEISNSIEANNGDDLVFGDEKIARKILPIAGKFRGVDFYDFLQLGTYQIKGESASDDNDTIDGGMGDDWVFAGDGSDNVKGGLGNDFLDGGEKIDTAIYEDVSADSIKLTQVSASALPQDIKDDNSPIFKLDFKRDNSDINEVDLLRNFEKVRFSDNIDILIVEGKIKFSDNILFEGGKSRSVPTETTKNSKDILDFSQYGSSINISKSSEDNNDENKILSIELYDNVIESIVQGSKGVKFIDFEHVIGSNFKDYLDLRYLSPGGELNDSQIREYTDARSMPRWNNLGDPNNVADATDARVQAAAKIDQNQQDVLIQGGAGNDTIIGTLAGADRIEGGAGNDHLFAGGFTSALYGGAGTDYIEGGGFKSQLYGGNGSGTPDTEADIFGLAHGAMVMDAGTNDYAVWGGFKLSGGVQQSWMEKGWAYWTPASTLLAAAPLPTRAVLDVAFTLIDAPSMATFRYGLAGSGDDQQLIIQFARGRGGQAVIDHYKLDLTTGEATANITAFRQEIRKSSIDDFRAYLKLAMRAGFGVDAYGTDPLVLDLDGDGIELQRREAGSVYFDLDKDGFGERTAWVKGDDGLLARDLNGNGRIDDIGELFGTATTSGFSALQSLDSDADGRITAADQAYSSLMVWQDRNRNGTTDAGELRTLAEAGIAEIGLSASASSAVIAGSTVRALGTFTRTDGSTSRIADVVLDNDETDSRYLGSTAVSEAAAGLPKLKGYGTVKDLAVAMSEDPTLLSAVADFDALAPDTSWSTLEQATQSILFRWAGVDGVAPTPMAGGVFDQRQLAFLERYMGRALARRDANGAPVDANVDELITSWSDVLAKATARLALQGPLGGTGPGVVYDANSDRFGSTGPSALADVMSAALTRLSSDPETALRQWTESWGPLLAELSDALDRADRVNVKTDFVVQSLVRAMDGKSISLSLSQLVAGLALDDVIVGTDRADNLSRPAAYKLTTSVGGAGNDTLTGGTGQDVWVFGRNFGQDVVNDQEALDSGDRIRFATYNSDDVTMRRSGDDLIISVKGTSDKITVRNQFIMPVMSLSGKQYSADWGIEEIQFADGTIFEAIDISAVVGLGSDGNDTIDGSGLADEIEGLKGDDLLRGGDGGDSYYYTTGDGHDTISDVMTNPALKGPDSIVLLGGLTASDVKPTRDADSNDVRLNFTSGGSITIKNQFMYDGLGYDTKITADSRIEAVFFDMGAAWSWIDLQQNTIAAYTTSGSDVTYGFGTSDQFYSSSGNDTMVGFDGGDRYRFERGSGQDIIHDRSRYPQTFLALLVEYNWDAEDSVTFGAGIRPEDVTFTRLGAAPDLQIKIKDSDDSLVVKGQFDGFKLDLFSLLGIAWLDRIESFKFEDGTILTWEDVLRTVTTGSAADDVLYGTYYPDVIDGKAGNDTLSGGDDGDTYIFDRGYGYDTIMDHQTNLLTKNEDVIKFGPGVAVNDVVFSRDGKNDLIISLAGTSDVLRIKDQYDAFETGVFGAQAFEQIEKFVWADGTVKTWANVHAEMVAAARTAGNDTIRGWYYADTLDGGAGDDRLEGGNGSDTYLFNRGEGSDTIWEEVNHPTAPNDDTVVFGSGITASDIKISRYGSNLENVRFELKDNLESLSIELQFDYFTLRWRPNRIEHFVFADGSTWDASDVHVQYLLQSRTAGNDLIEGFWTDDLIEGGAGNDTLRGGDGSDTYRFDLGFGQDTIEEAVHVITYSNDDVIEFGEGFDLSDLRLMRRGSDLELSFGSTSDAVLIKEQFVSAAWYGSWSDIETIKFADGSSLSAEQVRAQLIRQSKTSGDDVINGFYTFDTLDGGAGNDTLAGSSGGDTYLFGRGYGHDTIIESLDDHIFTDGLDAVVFDASVKLEDVSFKRSGNDLVIKIDETGETVNVSDQFINEYRQIELIRFDDGRTILARDAEVRGVQALATLGDDVMAGSRSDEYLDALAGNDSILGNGGDDQIIAGIGNDTLIGGTGSDTYLFGRGDGQDTIIDRGDGSYGAIIDRLQFKAGIAPGDVQLSRVNNDLVLRLAGTSDQVTVSGHFTQLANGYYTDNHLEQFAFADGTLWTAAEVEARVLREAATPGNDRIVAYDLNETLEGGAGDDTLTGGAGSDTYLFGRGDGRDVITEQGNSSYDTLIDRLQFKAGIAPGDVQLSRVNNDLVLRLAGTSDQVTVSGHFRQLANGYYTDNHLEQFAFADGTLWTAAEVEARVLREAATPGNDRIVAYDLNETLEGGAGDDTLTGGVGSDTYLFGRGDGRDVITEQGNSSYDTLIDRLQFKAGIAPGDVQLSRVNNDLVLRLAGTSDQVTVSGHFTQLANGYYTDNHLEQFAFADGTLWTAAEVEARVLREAATPGNDRIVAYDLNETLEGGAGDDTLTGGVGSDTYLFGRGDGRDVITEQGNSSYDTLIDRLQFKAGIAPGDVQLSRVNNDLVLRLAGTSDQVTVSGHFRQLANGYYTDNHLEQFAFADGTLWTAAEVEARVLREAATAGNDDVRGYDINDTLDGASGDDTLRGGLGSDTYIIGRDLGNDVIQDGGFYFSDSDRVAFRSGVAPSDVSFVRNGTDLVIAISGSSDKITIKGGLYGTFANSAYSYDDQIEFFDFADGTRVSLDDVRKRLLNGDDASNEIWGYQTSDSLIGAGGNDTIFGGAGDDLLLGQAGDDILYGQAGTDTLDGGAGNDTLDGGVGADRLFGGSGDDWIIISSATKDVDGGSGTDSGVFSGFSKDYLVSFGGGQTKVGVKGGDNTVVLSGVEKLVFVGQSGPNDDEIVLVPDAGSSTLPEITVGGTDGSEVLEGTWENDVFRGRRGDDTLIGSAGSDTYIYFSGDGNDYINDDPGFTNNLDVLLFGDLNRDGIELSRDDVQLNIKILSTGETISVAKQFFSDVDYRGLEKIQFADGSSVDRGDILAATDSGLPVVTVQGTSATEILEGTWENDVFRGRHGNDTLVGSAGSDTYIYFSGDGNDYINDDPGFTNNLDVLLFGDLNRDGIELSRDDVQLNIKILSTGETISVAKQFFSDVDYRGLEKIQFADGSSLNRSDIIDAVSSNIPVVTVQGTSAAESLEGTWENDVFRGGLGDDTLLGSAGSDTYIYYSGDGNDYIDDEAGFTNNTDILLLANINIDDVRFARNGVHLDISIIGTGEKITIDEQFYSDVDFWGVEKIQFADGSSIDRTDLNYLA